MPDTAARPDGPTPAAYWHRPGAAAVLAAAVLGCLLLAVLDLPRDRAALPVIARHAMQIALPRWGTTETVSEVVYGSRGWDTFGETFLLLAAVVSVALLSRGKEPRLEWVGEASAGRQEQARADPAPSSGPDEDAARSAEDVEQDAPAADDADDMPVGVTGPKPAEAMTVVVRVAARIVAPVLLVAAVYLAAWGYTPGGGFPAGAAVTGVLVLLYGALGHRALRRLLRTTTLEAVEMLGALAIVAVGYGGLLAEGSFFANWVTLAPQQTIRAGGTLQLFSGAEFVEVATGLSVAIFAMLGMSHEWVPDESDDR